MLQVWSPTIDATSQIATYLSFNCHLSVCIIHLSSVHNLLLKLLLLSWIEFWISTLCLKPGSSADIFHYSQHTTHQNSNFALLSIQKSLCSYSFPSLKSQASLNSLIFFTSLDLWNYSVIDDSEQTDRWYTYLLCEVYYVTVVINIQDWNKGTCLYYSHRYKGK